MGESLQLKGISLSMLTKRILVIIALLPIGAAVMAAGGLVYSSFIVLMLGLAAWEYWRLFCSGGVQPSAFFVIGGTVLLAAGRALGGLETAAWVLGAVVLGSMAYHLVAYERGRDQAASDFGVTVGGAVYLGWIGSYIIALRDLPEGKWWVLVVLFAVMFADVGAFAVGRSLGRHKISPRLSPKKSWEGYLGGILISTMCTAGTAWVWAFGAGPGTALNPARGALLGFSLATLTLLGDLGESMIKRQVGAKDSGTLLPGHGGVFDRIDSWLWAGVISFYIITWFFI